MSKVAIIGIDGFDPFIIDKWKNELPNIGRLYTEKSEITVESTFPPDSICAWTSIYTGENPAEHGLIESIDYLSGRKSDHGKERASNFQGKTFWDIAGSRGKKVCVINPFVAYPAWKVNGIMVSGPVFEGGETSAYPGTVLSEYSFPPLGGMVDFPDEKYLDTFLAKSKKLTEELADVGLKIYQEQNPDLFFLTFLTLDRIKHFLWRFTDKEDIFYPGANNFHESVKRFYLLFDEIIGRYKNELYEGVTLIVMSDHGHRRRCIKCLNLNEILRRKGYLSVSGKGLKSICKKLVERTKVFTVNSLSKYGYQDCIYKIAKFIPHRKALKKSSYLINKEDSFASLSNICGTNPYGGIDIKAASDREYEKLRNNITSELLKINEDYSENIVKWVEKREQIYRGRHERMLPDILFELNEEYGVGMDLYTEPITQNYSHKKISGGHKREGVLLQQGGDVKIKNIERPATIEGIKDYILQILDL
jgi:predicted AlkP superfamily phosphohydrolase/phosphomutase